MGGDWWRGGVTLGGGASEEWGRSLVEKWAG